MANTSKQLKETSINSFFNLLAKEKTLLRAMDISDEVQSRISNLSYKQINEITKNAQRFLNIHAEIDNEALCLEIAKSINNQQERDLETKFFRLHATSKMMRELFGIHTEEFSLRRKKLGLNRCNQHRPKYCNEETEANIWQAWRANEHIEDLRHRYITVHKQTGQPMNLLWAAVRRYYELA